MPTIENTKKHIKASIDTKIATYIWGAPGIGKSEIVEQVAKDNDMQFIDVRAALTDVGDWSGLPVDTINAKGHKEFTFLPSSFLPTDPNFKGIIFLDELNRARTEILNCVMQILLTGKILNHYTLPKGAIIVAAGNPSDDNEQVTELGDALLNRFCHLNLEPSHDEWVSYAKETGVRGDIISFVQTFPKHLQGKHTPFNLSQLKPSPRAFTRLSKYIDQLDKNGDIETCGLDASVGFLGHEIGVAYDRHRKESYTVIDVEKVINNYSSIRKTVKKMYKDGKLPEQKQAVEELFDNNIANDEKWSKNAETLTNIFTFLLDIAPDVAYVGISKIFHDYDNIQNVVSKWAGNKKNPNHKIGSDVFALLEKLEDAPEAKKPVETETKVPF